MVTSDDKPTMLGTWRLALRQAEEAAKAGRYDEAIALAARPDVADHRRMASLKAKIGRDLIARGTRRAEAEDLPGAVEDFRLAEAVGAGPDDLASARLRVADRAAVEIRGELDAGEPARVVERIDELARLKIGGPALRRAREVAEAWRIAMDEARRGEFGRATEAIDRAERFAAGSVPSGLVAARDDIERRRAAAHPRVEALYAALEAARWPEVLASADALLEVVPEHPAARQARSKAWRHVGAIGPASIASADAWPSRSAQARLAKAPVLATEPAGRPAAAAPDRTPPARAAARGLRGRFLLWVDAVGGFLVCLDDRVTLGRAGPDGDADIALLGDLARDHAAIARHGDGYTLQASRPTFLNGEPVTNAPLKDGDVIRLGSSVELEFRQPSPVSATARLEVVSRHRLPLAVDAVLLMAETCIVGPSAQAHIAASNLDGPVVLYRQGDGLACRAPGAFEVDGKSCASRAPITRKSSVLGDGYSFSLEPLADRPEPA